MPIDSLLDYPAFNFHRIQVNDADLRQQPPAGTPNEDVTFQIRAVLIADDQITLSTQEWVRVEDAINEMLSLLDGTTTQKFTRVNGAVRVVGSAVPPASLWQQAGSGGSGGIE